MNDYLLMIMCSCYSEEDRQWFMEAMQGHTIDSISRMKQISQIMKMPEHLLDSQGVTTDDLEGSFTLFQCLIIRRFDLFFSSKTCVLLFGQECWMSCKNTSSQSI